MLTHEIQLVECPRDAMQGWTHFIPTSQKIAYINQLLQVGFHTLDCLSFVSAKAIPQMADSHEVVKQLDLKNSRTKVLAIVANERGANDAIQYDAIHVLGYPFSISPTFQQRNANSTIDESWERLMRIQSLCTKYSKDLVVYVSMGFGNPYGDAFDAELVIEWVHRLKAAGIKIISLADTVGLATAETVSVITASVFKENNDIQIGVHLHSTAANWQAKMEAAYNMGCRRFDGALKGFGGCPMADDTLVGNMNSELMIPFLVAKGETPIVSNHALQIASGMAADIFIQ